MICKKTSDSLVEQEERFHGDILADGCAIWTQAPEEYTPERQRELERQLCEVTLDVDRRMHNVLPNR